MMVRTLARLAAIGAGAMLGTAMIAGAAHAPETYEREQGVLASELDSRGDGDGIGEMQALTSGAVVEEDDPRFDCRVHGNQACGVTINGERYVVTFTDGLPVTVAPLDNEV